MRPALLSLFLGLFLFQSIAAQQKFEREVRIQKIEVPSKALEFIKSLSFNTKFKWYKETGLNRTSFEAKTKYKRKKYSIEFDTQGTLEDVEIVIREKEISKNVLEKIRSQLQQDLSKYRIEKIQIQYSGKLQSVIQKIKQNQDSRELVTRYELIISAKKNGKYQKFEYLFSDDGIFLQQQSILLKNTDNLEY